MFLASRRNLLAAEAAVANELDFNAQTISDHEQSGAGLSPATQERIILRAWEAHEATLHVLTKKKDSTLWQEVSDAYAGIRRTKVQGSMPPPSELLRELARRLREVST